MGWIVDHTGELRQLRPAFLGPTLHWPPQPQGPEYEIGFVQVTHRAVAEAVRAVVLNNAKARDARTPYSKGVNPRVIALREMEGGEG